VPTGWKQNVFCENLDYDLPATSNVRSVNRCVVHALDSFHTTNPTRDDETRHVDGSVHEVRVKDNVKVSGRVTIRVKASLMSSFLHFRILYLPSLRLGLPDVEVNSVAIHSSQSGVDCRRYALDGERPDSLRAQVPFGIRQDCGHVGPTPRSTLSGVPRALVT